MNFQTLADLRTIDNELKQKKQQHQEDGLYDVKDITVYVDMYRKSIVKHRGSDFSTGRINPEDVLSGVNIYFGKKFEITRLDKFDLFPVVHLKEVRTK
jgi:hypothetical protein